MDNREKVLSYFEERVRAGEYRAVRHIEENLELPYKSLSNLLNQMSTGDDSPLVTAPGPYTGEGEPHRPLYKCYARRA